MNCLLGSSTLPLAFTSSQGTNGPAGPSYPEPTGSYAGTILGGPSMRPTHNQLMPDLRSMS